MEDDLVEKLLFQTWAGEDDVDPPGLGFDRRPAEGRDGVDQEEGVALLVFQANNPLREAWVDEQTFLSSRLYR